MTVAVGVVTDAVKLEVNIPQAGVKGPAAEFLALGELNAVRSRLHAVESTLPRVADGVDK